MRASIRQVAFHAGVSPKTVTNVLRGREGEVSPITQQRVLQSVQELSYVPVASPMQNRHVETRVIGVVFDEVDAATDFWGLMTLRGLRQGALEHGYDLLLMLRPSPDWAVGREEAQFLDRRSDGIVFVAPVERHKVLAALVENEIPVVSCHNTDVPAGVAHVTGDNVLAGQLAAEHIVKKGHTRIAYIDGSRAKSDFRQRRAGFDAILKKARLKAACVVQINNSQALPTDATVQKLLAAKASAVVCANDEFALKLWMEARTSGVRVPEDLSIVGMDDTPAAEKAGLTTVHNDCEAIGKGAINSLVKMLRGVACDQCHHTTGVRLIERSSTANRS